MAVCATCSAAAEVAPPLRAPGLLDRALTLRAPGPAERAALLAHALATRGVAYAPEHVEARPHAPLDVTEMHVHGFEARCAHSVLHAAGGLLTCLLCLGARQSRSSCLAFKYRLNKYAHVCQLISSLHLHRSCGLGQVAGRSAAGLTAGCTPPVQAFARRLEGCDAADVRAFLERALHAAVARRLAAPDAGLPPSSGQAKP